MDTDKKGKEKKRNPKALIKNITKKISVLTLTALLLFSSIFSCYEIEVSASSSSAFDNKVQELLDSIGSTGATNFIDLVRSGSYAAGAVLGGAAGTNLGIPPQVGSAMGAWAFGSLANGALDWYENNNVETERVHSGGGRSFKAVKKSGVPTTQNSTNYNTTKNISIYNENKTWNNTTNNYDYTYNWYNPITNTYNTTNEYTYNTTYNTYNYVTHNYDITNNYNYTTNYYIQDNRTYVSYYIINVCDETQEEEETYIEMYYELPDGRNSLYLTVDDIKGQYFPSNYSKYISVAEDDGTTLGLWHLDGDLKDSSYHGNTAGSAYNNVYTDGLYSNGKQFSDSDDDFLELKLDKVDLPSSWTLEWCEYIPSSGISESVISTTSPSYSSSSGYSEVSHSSLYSHYYFSDSAYDLNYDIYLNGYLGIDGVNSLFEPVAGYFVPYSITFDGNNYKFYRNGNLIYEFDYKTLSFQRLYNKAGNEAVGGTYVLSEFDDLDISLSGISVNSDSIRFYGSPSLVGSFKGSDFVKGRYQKFSSSDGGNYFYSYPIYNFYTKAHSNAIVDEVRLSSGVLYSGDTYTPSSQPYTTNTVLAVPENPQKHEIAFKTNTDISDVRFGGARPTYPTNGYVYVSLDTDDKVESIQQYQEDGWYEIEASLYTGTDWVSFKEVNMEYLGIDGVGDSSGNSGGDSGDTGGDSGDNSNDSSGGGVQAILDGIGKFFDTLLNLVGKIIGLFSGFVDSVLSLFEGFTVFTDGFSGFLTATFGFLPPEAINVLVAGITLIVILAIIKFLK